MTEDEVVGRHHPCNGHEFEQAPGDGEGQGGLACCSFWGRKELDTSERLNYNCISTLPHFLFFQKGCDVSPNTSEICWSMFPSYILEPL